MDNFYKIGGGFNVIPLMHSVTINKHLWNQHRERQLFENSPHSKVDDIWLRFNEKRDNRLPENVGDELEMINYPAMAELAALDTCLSVMRMVNGDRLGRVIITRLSPGERIAPHADQLGAYSHYYERYHLVLHGLPGSLFRAGAEEVNMLTGDLWWFDAHQVHEVINNSPDHRVHMLIDCRISK